MNGEMPVILYACGDVAGEVPGEMVFVVWSAEDELVEGVVAVDEFGGVEAAAEGTFEAVGLGLENGGVESGGVESECGWEI